MTLQLKSACLVFAGGGTGGHFFPAVAIADRISELLRDTCPVEIHFVGTKRGVEYRLRESLGYTFHTINMRGVARSLTLKNLLVPFVVIGALVKSWLLLGRIAPDVVVGTGGYVAWPVVRAAAARGIPTVLQEQNSFPGVTTRRLAPLVRRMYLGFEGAKALLKTTGSVTFTGNPVRPSVLGGDRQAACRHFALDPAKRTILIFGGSQGARAINEAVLRSFETAPLADGYQLLWQTGRLGYEDILNRLGDQASGQALFPFSERMDLVYAAADIAIARAGALTIAELQACAVPAVLVPYPQAAGDHQRKNAREYAAHKTAVVIDQDELPGLDLLEKAVELLASGEAENMKEQILKTRPDVPAVDVIAQDIINLIEEHQVTGGQA
jgi:UDP-N-acetylglucosamine--N-acetylmuramyl-(pentapeptide) pyrophosphoryl-undecaprenol N-acetylglucosamine transferase